MKARTAIVLLALGLAFLALAMLGIRSLPPTGIPLIYGSIMLGLLFSMLGILRFVYGPLRHSTSGSGPAEIGYSGISPDGGHGGGCGDGGGGFDGGGCGDGGGGH